jgi:dienelactone hydrolase
VAREALSEVAWRAAGHAFMNESPAPFDSFDARTAKMGFPAYDQAQGDLAWGRLLSFLAAHLKGGGS